MVTVVATYRDLGERLGIDVCTGCSLEVNHLAGAWGADGRLHYAERAMRRSSIRDFIWRASAQWAALTGSPAGSNDPRWQRYWNRVEWAKWALRELRIRLPASAWDHERATLRALLAVPPQARDFFSDNFAEQRGVARKAAIRWAKKPVDPGAAADYDD